jgi:hypothetical protein
MQKSSNKLLEVGIGARSDTVKDGKGGHKLPLRLKLSRALIPPQIKDGKGEHKLPLRLKQTKPGFDTRADKRWQRWA